MTAILDWVLFVLSKLKTSKTQPTAAAVVTTPTVTVETDSHTPTEPVTIDVTVNEEAKVPSVETN